MPRLTLFFAVAIPSLLACGGVWSDASKQAVGQTCRELPERLQAVPDSPHKDRVNELLAQCAIDGDAGMITIIGVARFSAEIQTIADDGKIDDAELLSIENAYDQMMSDR